MEFTLEVYWGKFRITYYERDERQVKDEVFLDNLPRTANQILNVLWSRNRAMAVGELVEQVNAEYKINLERRELQKFIKLLVSADYIEAKRHGLHIYYQTLGLEYVAECL